MMARRKVLLARHVSLSAYMNICSVKACGFGLEATPGMTSCAANLALESGAPVEAFIKVRYFCGAPLNLIVRPLHAQNRTAPRLLADEVKGGIENRH